MPRRKRHHQVVEAKFIEENPNKPDNPYNKTSLRTRRTLREHLKDLPQGAPSFNTPEERYDDFALFCDVLTERLGAVIFDNIELLYSTDPEQRMDAREDIRILTGVIAEAKRTLAQMHKLLGIGEGPILLPNGQPRQLIAIPHKTAGTWEDQFSGPEIKTVN